MLPSLLSSLTPYSSYFLFPYPILYSSCPFICVISLCSLSPAPSLPLPPPPPLCICKHTCVHIWVWVHICHSSLVGVKRILGVLYYLSTLFLRQSLLAQYRIFQMSAQWSYRDFSCPCLPTSHPNAWISYMVSYQVLSWESCTARILLEKVYRTSFIIP